LPGIHWVHGTSVASCRRIICDRRFGGLDERAHQRMGDAADRCSDARARGQRAHARQLRNHAHLFRRCRIPDCVEPEVHVSDRRPGNVDNCCRGIVAEASPGDSIERQSEMHPCWCNLSDSAFRLGLVLRAPIKFFRFFSNHQA
jgi:hypothetical protein